MQGIHKGMERVRKQNIHGGNRRNIPEEGKGEETWMRILWLAAVVVLLVIEIATLGLTTILVCRRCTDRPDSGGGRCRKYRAVCDISDCFTDITDFYKTGGGEVSECQSNPYQCGKPDWERGCGDTDD